MVLLNKSGTKCCIMSTVGLASIALMTFGTITRTAFSVETKKPAMSLAFSVSNKSDFENRTWMKGSSSQADQPAEFQESVELEHRIHLVPPSTEPYELKQAITDNLTAHRSQFGQDFALEPLLLQIPNGFFVESGAYDGESISNTFYYEWLGWQGLLIEPSSKYELLMRKHRKAWIFHGALSPDGTSQDLNFRDQGLRSHVDPSAESKVPAEPLAKILAALDPARRTVDFWSLDIEGSECDVLLSTDFKEISVGVLLIEMNKPGKHNNCISAVMEENGFQEIGDIEVDHVFVNSAYFRERGLSIPKFINDD